MTRIILALLIVFLSGCAAAFILPVNQEQLKSAKARFERITQEQANEDPMIGLWSAIVGAERFEIAIAKTSDSTSSYRFTGFVIGGSNSFVSRNGIGSPAFRLNPTAMEGVYEGETVWCRVLVPEELPDPCLMRTWRPSRFIMKGQNLFTVYHSTEFRTIGGSVRDYVRMPN